MYTLNTILGRGSYGIIMKCNKILPDDSEKEVLLKINTVDHEEPLSFSANVSEPVNMKRFSHPNIIKLEEVSISRNDLRDIFTDEENVKTIQSLANRMHYHKIDNIVMEIEKGDSDLSRNTEENEMIRKKILVDVLLGLEHLHQNGIAHLDLKGNNIIRKGNTYKICDFGMATFTGPSNYICSYMVGPMMKPPELIAYFHNTMNDGIDKVTKIPDCVQLEKVDIWCFGILWMKLSSSSKFDFDRIGFYENGKLHPFNTLLNHLMMESVSNEDLRFLNEICPHVIEMYRKYCSDRPDPYKISEDLLKRIFSIRPSNRPSATECLDDPYFSEFSEYINQVRRENKIKVKYIYKTDEEYFLKVNKSCFSIGSLILYHKLLFFCPELKELSEDEKFYIQCAGHYLIYKYFIKDFHTIKFNLKVYLKLSNKSFRIQNHNQAIQKIERWEEEILTRLNWEICDVNVADFIDDIEIFLNCFENLENGKMEVSEFLKKMKL